MKTGLLATINGWEYWLLATTFEVFRVAEGNRAYLLHLDILSPDSGIPANARWECSLAHFERYLRPQAA